MPLTPKSSSTRRLLAIGILMLVGVMELIAGFSLLVNVIPTERIRDFSTLVLEPLIGLCGVAFGYYFGRDRN